MLLSKFKSALLLLSKEGKNQPIKQKFPHSLNSFIHSLNAHFPGTY